MMIIIHGYVYVDYYIDEDDDQEGKNNKTGFIQVGVCIMILVEIINLIVLLSLINLYLYMNTNSMTCAEGEIF